MIEIKEASVVKIEPGDVIVLKSDMALSLKEMDRITSYYKSAFPNNEVKVLASHMRMFIARGEKNERSEQCEHNGKADR